MQAGRWPSRAEAEELLFEFTKGDALRRHGRAVEEAMRAYAGWFGVTDRAEVERWGVVGLLHDFDYEQNPTEDRHLHVGGRILRDRGYDEEMVRTIESHANYMNVPRDTPMKKAIFACDELVGFIGACVKVRPSKAIEDLPVSSVLKRLKDKAFARAVNRADVHDGAAGLPRPLEEHVSFTIETLKRIATEIGLALLLVGLEFVPFRG
ncbi:MAG: HDIG domain-containing metalloprotein [Actinomycetota bacterium]